MKKTIYSIIFAGMAAMSLSSCAGHEEYDAYVATLKEQPAVIDTISSPASYTAYLNTLENEAKTFDQLGVKLDKNQKDEIATLSSRIQAALVDKYNQLTAQAAEQESAPEEEPVLEE